MHNGAPGSYPLKSRYMDLHCAGILFDLDGVLVNSIAAGERQWRIWAHSHGLDPAHVVHVAHGKPTIETVRELAPHLDATREMVIIEQGEIGDIEDLTASEGAAELLASLPEDRWAIVTSGTRPLATARLHAAGLPVPARMITASEIVRGKPDPEPYLKGATSLGLSPGDCIVFEDAPPGVRSAKAAGAAVVAIPGTYAAADLREADALVTSLRQVEVRYTNGLLHVLLSGFDT